VSTDTNIETARNFFIALEAFDTAKLLDFISPDAERIEWPNRLKPKGNNQNFTQMLADAARAKTVITAQTYAVTHVAASENHVMVEYVWTGTLAIAIGALAAGDRMKAHCVAAFDFENAKICRLRNYDCYDEF
jgi:ketosteroid isomerase-like protein